MTGQEPSARQIAAELRRIAAELDELGRAAPPRWRERIAWCAITTEYVARVIESDLTGPTELPPSSVLGGDHAELRTAVPGAGHAFAEYRVSVKPCLWD